REAYVLTRKLLHEGKIEIPDHPRLIRQLKDVVAKPLPGGGIQISSPRKADGSHGDLVSAFVNAVWRAHDVVVRGDIDDTPKLIDASKAGNWSRYTDLDDPYR
ncbi:MAG TPA: hypothetical protein VLT45_01715, partial [Kofleriaceae bacterium]|nr:hypothetical protein [Kofleriaceae bacterium]